MKLSIITEGPVVHPMNPFELGCCDLSEAVWARAEGQGDVDAKRVISNAK